MQVPLSPRNTHRAIAESSNEKTFILSIPSGRKGKYRWAQFDDYLHRPRRNFEWEAPCQLSLEARCSNLVHDGTWGFGLWNDPFNTSLGISGSVRRLPVLPNCAWFFYASDHNYLSFHNHLPAQGFLAATFSSPLIPPVIFGLGIPFVPLLFFKKLARIARYGLGALIRQDATLLQMDTTKWHTFQIDWQRKIVVFSVDHQIVLETMISPRGKQGLVIWVDNQYAAFPPDGQLLFGTLASNVSTTLEIQNLQMN
jgi:hypothetical protein